MADLTGMSTDDVRVFGVQYLDRAYCWNGRNRPRKYDRVAWQNSGILRFPFVPLVAAAAGANLLGTYRYYVVPVNSKQFNKNGLVVAGIPSFVSAEVEATNQGVTVSGIPSAHPDSQVDFWHIFRNKAGTYDTDASDSTLDFFLVGRVAVGTTSYTDDVGDDQLKDAERIRFDQNFMPAFKVGGLYGDRLFGMGFEPITTPTATLATKTVTNKAKTSGIATLTTSAAHGYNVGDVVTVNISDTRFDGPAYILTTPLTTTFTYARPGDDFTSAAGSGTTEVVNLSAAVPDGVRGCLFQKSGAAKVYRISGINSTTQIALDSGFTDTPLSATAMRIFRNPWEIYFSEFNDVEAGGPDGELGRNQLALPGKEGAIAWCVWDGRGLVFGALNTFSIEGKGPDRFQLKVSPEPIFQGYGAIGPDAVWVSGADLYAIGTLGPWRVRPGSGPELFGSKLLLDWLDSLTGAEQALINIYGNSRQIWINFPETGGAETSRTWRYEIATDDWWEERPTYAKFGFLDDGDGGVQGQAYHVVGGEIHQPDYGTKDGPAVYSGAVTTGGTLSFAASAAAFQTTSGGLDNLIVRFYQPATGTNPGKLIGERRITSNSATVVNWASSGAGGGALTVAIGDLYEIGSIAWNWTTKEYLVPGHAVKNEKMLIGVKDVDSAKSVKIVDIWDGTEANSGAPDSITTALLEIVKEVGQRTQKYQARIESRDNAVLRHVTLVSDQKATNE